MKKITKNLFDLTEEQKQTSISMYGKVIKCLIAPYHSIKDIPLEPNDEVYVYPERDLNIQQRKEIVSVMARSQKNEICFVTSDLFIILDMIDCCCRILTPDGKIEEVNEKTFAANPHTIIYKVIHNDYHVKEQKDNQKDFKNTINEIIDDINSKKGMTLEKMEQTKITIKLIGEPLIREKLLEMLSDVKIIPEEYKKNGLTGKVEFTKEETDFINKLSWSEKGLTIKQCIEKSRDGIELTQQILKNTDKIIDLMKGDSKYSEEILKKTSEKNDNEKELKIRHKLDYWLSEQDEKSKFKDVAKF